MAGANLRKRGSAAWALAWLMLPGPAHATGAPNSGAPNIGEHGSGTPSSGIQCELHLWAAAGMGRTIQSAHDNLSVNWSGFSIANPLARANKDSTAVHTLAATADGPMPTNRQLAVLAGLDLPARLGAGGYRLVVHDQPLDSRTLRVVSGRYAATKAACYADLVLADLDYSREYAHGQNLKAFFRFRDFGAAAVPLRRLATSTETKLKIRREDAAADLAASDAELADALAANLIKFAGYLGGAK